jgi:hypothetical protein
MHVTCSWPEFIHALTTCNIMMAIVLLCIWVAVILGQVCFGTTVVVRKNIMEVFGVFITTLLGIAIEAVVLDQIYMDN